MLKMGIVLQGGSAVQSDIRKMVERSKDRLPLMKLIGITLRREYIKNMNKGTDPDGRKLAPVQKWTRVIGLGAGASRTNKKAIPLLNTGMLRNSMGTVAVNKDRLEFGWKGPQLDKAYRMIKGIPGLMLVKSAFIRRAAAGHQYIRVQLDDGAYTALRVKGGGVMIKPQKRDFFYLGKKQRAYVERLFDEWATALAEGKKLKGVAA